MEEKNTPNTFFGRISICVRPLSQPGASTPGAWGALATTFFAKQCCFTTGPQCLNVSISAKKIDILLSGTSDENLQNKRCLVGELFYLYVCLSTYSLSFLGTIAKLWPILKRLIFKQCLIHTRLSFKKDGFNNKLCFLLQLKQDFFKWYCLKMHVSLNNVV